MKGRTYKRKSCARLNFNVYARHTTLCLYFITRVKFTLRAYARKIMQQWKSTLRGVFYNFCKIDNCIFFPIIERFFNLWNIAKDVWASKSVPAGMRSMKQLPAAAVLLKILNLVLSLKWSFKLVFLCLHSLVPNYFSLYFTRFSNIHNYSTRQSMRLSLPNVKQNFGKRTFLFTGAKIFNKLPLNVVKSENIQTFCRRARHFIFFLS